MKKCTQIDKVQIKDIKESEIDKPLVSILLAVYKPNEQWLIEQLISLNKQSYENLNLYIYDDCPDYPVKEDLFKEYIKNFEYKIIKGKYNKGSNIAFEELTKIADGEYFAYCDQDDIWEENKISIMMDRFGKTSVDLVCCDLSIIDENSNKTHESIRKIRKRIVYKSGSNLAKDLLVKNFVTGCAMIVKSDIAVKAIPFANNIVHDQWIAIISALNGEIDFVNQKLVRYRQHSSNQTGILKNVFDKESYYYNRIDLFINRLDEYSERIGNYKEVEIEIDNCLKWLKARKGYSQKISLKDLKIIVKYRHFQKVSMVLDILLPFIPNFIFRYIIKLAQKGIL